VTEVHWCIIANLRFKFRSHFTAHCGRRVARRAACGRIISRAMLASARLFCYSLSTEQRANTMPASNVTVAFDWNDPSPTTESAVDDCWTTLRCQLETTRFVVQKIASGVLCSCGKTSDAVQKILMPLLVTFGVLGNAVSVAVLTRPWMKSSTNSYLTTLAVYDLLYLVLDPAVSLTLTVM